MSVKGEVVVTGLGAVTPVGISVSETWTALENGDDGFGPPVFEETHFRCGAFARVPDRFSQEWRGQDGLDNLTKFALSAAREAWLTAGLQPLSDTGRRYGCVLGTGGGGEWVHDDALRQIYAEGRTRLHPSTLPNAMVSGSASRIAIDLGLRGPNFTVSSACASGLHAIAQAASIIRAGDADVMLAGGADAPFALGSLRSWEALRVMSPTMCRPFAPDRDGMTLAEGAAVLVLEREDLALSRGAKILARLGRCGMTCDAQEMVTSSSAGMADAMRIALGDRIADELPDFILAHGTGTLQNDSEERDAIGRFFDPFPPIFSLKGRVGHMMGGSGALNAVIAVLALRRGKMPIAANICDEALDIGKNTFGGRWNSSLINAFAFGGLNVSMVMSRT